MRRRVSVVVAPTELAPAFGAALTERSGSSGLEDELTNVLRVEGIASEAEQQQFYAKAPIRSYRVTPPASMAPALTRSLKTTVARRL